jgi:hypothetical protein
VELANSMINRKDFCGFVAVGARTLKVPVDLIGLSIYLSIYLSVVHGGRFFSN